MKYIFLFLASVGMLSCAMESSSTSKGFTNPTLNAKYVRLVPDTSTMMLIQGVRIEYGDVSLEADSVLYEKKLKTITVYGPQHVRFKGEPVAVGRTEVLRYTMGKVRFNIMNDSGGVPGRGIRYR